MQTSDLDSLITESLHSFYQDICSEWSGRENEAVNLYALGHLAKHVHPETILHDLTQIGIEVAVRQLPREKFKGKERTVRKDLVIWPTPRMTLWKESGPHNEPLAVMEWKVNHSSTRMHSENRRTHRDDVQWLRTTSLRSGMSEFVGYAVLVENTHNPKRICCVRVRDGTIQERWFERPIAGGSGTASI